ncbi:hypothetical protein PPMP20_02675 [Paraburkholderia phymatum]|uniref:Integral membrane protein n=1 Tax=Paraburkholderia phymatum (strain DSM 17167 / CIP 108236 / LMG 21445 / STM815) TaxID=391038 RepID=B2JWL5_PARP8|nr:membrane protein [Paraburkholderia phymatum]ACC75342.1 integral membrane protein [Paraburkholderia phymatum STM815]
MDQRNLFDTPATYRLLRLENLAGLLVALAMLATHYTQVRWWTFVLLFAYIDAIGYLPGAIAYRRAHGRSISQAYYFLYNSTHSLLSGLAVAGIWAIVVGPEWALLAIPIHLFGDRSIFGNFLKPFGVSFEPVAHPAFSRFQSSYASHAVDDERSRDVPL